MAEQVGELQGYLVDFVDEIFLHDQVLFEGAQGTYLDIIHGEYPYVTSSHCTIGGAIVNGIPPQSVRRVYGVAKAYETYVGAKKFNDGQEVFAQLQAMGHEFGATTGRPRQCNFLDLDRLVRAVRINGVTDLIINKVDILREMDCWKCSVGGAILDTGSEEGFKLVIERAFDGIGLENIIFSYSPERI